MNWNFTPHALRRAVEMAVGPDEIRKALVSPERVYASRQGRQVRQSDRIALVTESGGVVITCLWKAGAGQRWDRSDISLSRDRT